MMPLPTPRALAHVDCQLVVLDFMAHFDAGDAEAAAALFAPDGRWERADGPVHGRAELMALIRARKPGTVVRHAMTNLRTRLESPDHAVVCTYVLLFKQVDATGHPSFPMALDGVAGVGRYRDELRHVDGRWLIVGKSSITEFKP